MKTWMSPTWISGLVLLLTCVPGRPAESEPERSRPPAPSAASALAPDRAATNQPSPAKIRLSPWTTEIVKLAQAGIEDSVVSSFIDNSGTFNLGADEIIHLNELGVSSQFITAMLQHDFDVISGARLLTITTQPPTEPLFPANLTTRCDVSNETATETVTVPAPSSVPAPELPDLSTAVSL